MLNKLLNLLKKQKKKEEVDIQAVFDKVFSYYPPDVLREGNFYMCSLLYLTKDRGDITLQEYQAAIKAITKYISPYNRMTTALKKNNLEGGVDFRLAIYLNWKCKPKLKELRNV